MYGGRPSQSSQWLPHPFLLLRTSSPPPPQYFPGVFHRCVYRGTRVWSGLPTPRGHQIGPLGDQGKDKARRSPFPKSLAFCRPHFLPAALATYTTDLPRLTAPASSSFPRNPSPLLAPSKSSSSRRLSSQDQEAACCRGRHQRCGDCCAGEPTPPSACLDFLEPTAHQHSQPTRKPVISPLRRYHRPHKSNRALPSGRLLAPYFPCALDRIIH